MMFYHHSGFLSFIFKFKDKNALFLNYKAQVHIYFKPGLALIGREGAAFKITSHDILLSTSSLLFSTNTSQSCTFSSQFSKPPLKTKISLCIRQKILHNT